MLAAFELHRPASVAEAASLLAARPNAALYAGGTELLLLMKAGLMRPADVIDIKRIPDLDGLVATITPSPTGDSGSWAPLAWPPDVGAEFIHISTLR